MPKKKTAGHSGYSNDDKRAYVARIKSGESVSSIARESGVSWNSVNTWVKKFGKASVIKKAPEPTNGHAPQAPKLGIVGLTPIIEGMCKAEMNSAIEKLLPAALDAALARRFGARDAKEG